MAKKTQKTAKKSQKSAKNLKKSIKNPEKSPKTDSKTACTHQKSDNCPKISVLVPVYNVEKYLPECLNSLTNQTLSAIEIICINDGSTDNSLKILQDYAERDPRIQIINKENSGYGASMNLGIKHAKGEYIGILEPDDFIELKAYEDLYRAAERFSADVVKADYFTEKNGKTTKQNLISNEHANKILSAQQNRWLFRLPPAIWSAIYRREFLIKQKIAFLETPGASYQDLGFNFKTLATAKVVVLIAEAYIHYRLDNENSSVNNPGKVDCVVAEYADIERFLKEHYLYREFGTTMVAAKLGNYHWNLQRLSPKLAKQFYRTMRTEFLDAAQNGLIDPTEYSLSRWFALQYILKYPRLAYFLMRLRSVFTR